MEKQEFYIEGIDIKKGLSRVAGRVKSYQKILRVFYQDMTLKLDEIAVYCKKKDIELYKTLVHGLKSSLANIGATELSLFAGKLEYAANISNWDFIESKNDTFITNFQQLLIHIDAALNKEVVTSVPAQTDNTKLTTILTELKNGLNEYDLSQIKTSSSALEGYLEQGGKITDAIKSILQNKLVGEYEQAIKDIDELLKIC